MIETIYMHDFDCASDEAHVFVSIPISIVYRSVGSAIVCVSMCYACCIYTLMAVSID